MNWEYRPKIATLRDKKQLTQLELAQLVGVTETTIANWERGRSGVEWIDRLIRLCDALDCEPEDLISYVPKFEDAASFSEMVRLIEEGHNNQTKDIGSEDIERIETIKKEGGKFSEIVKLIEAGQRVQAAKFLLSSTLNPARKTASQKVKRKRKSE